MQLLLRYSSRYGQSADYWFVTSLVSNPALYAIFSVAQLIIKTITSKVMNY